LAASSPEGGRRWSRLARLFLTLLGAALVTFGFYEYSAGAGPWSLLGLPLLLVGGGLFGVGTLGRRGLLRRRATPENISRSKSYQQPRAVRLPCVGRRHVSATRLAWPPANTRPSGLPPRARPRQPGQGRGDRPSLRSLLAAVGSVLGRICVKARLRQARLEPRAFTRRLHRHIAHEVVLADGDAQVAQDVRRRW